MVQTGPKIQSGGIEHWFMETGILTCNLRQGEKRSYCADQQRYCNTKNEQSDHRGGGNFIDDHEIVIRLAL